MKTVSIMILLFAVLSLLVGVYSAPITLIVGTPFLFNKFDYKVDPNRGAELSPAFQAQYGTLGADLINFYGQGNTPRKL
ncbi:hypothetical protein DAPPUDRAFT_303278 [Daphnia pulex]|uniref:Uncharacterized protein n=1 Tax=Daphnia pulex TaxID=6669 RepID=E9GFD6_DAPPU|nr:hypothetical protein DAPPUDRAFT_303278 [Daphnia pulex]|eukprot:EFX81829.1 hypothetical protein DAPPUDRAFT_303278 [Daphnia pulex]